MALRPLFPFQQTQYAQVSPMKPAPFYKLFAGLGSTNKSATSLLLSLSSSASFFLPKSLWQELSSLFYQTTMGPQTLISPREELARRGALLASSAIPCSLISRIHSSFFSDWRRTVSFFDPQVPSISTEKLVFPRHACCVLSRPRCIGHSLLLISDFSGIGRIENPFCSACGTSHLILHCPATDSAPLALWRLWSRPLGVARLLGLHGLPRCPHSSEEVG